MTLNHTKELPVSIKMMCHACGNMKATHVCRYDVDALKIQVCLCDQCLKMDTEHLLKDTLGIDDAPAESPHDYMM